MAKTQWNTMNNDAKRAFSDNKEARYRMTETVKALRKQVKNRQTVIETDESDLTKIEAGETAGIMRTADAIRANIKAQNEYIKVATLAIRKYQKAEKAIMAKVAEYFPEGMYTHYCHREDSAESLKEYRADFVAWGKLIGVTFSESTIDIFVGTVGDEILKGNKLLKSLDGLGSFKEEVWRDTMTLQVCKLAGIRPYTVGNNIDADSIIELYSK